MALFNGSKSRGRSFSVGGRGLNDRKGLVIGQFYSIRPEVVSPGGDQNGDQSDSFRRDDQKGQKTAPHHTVSVAVVEDQDEFFARNVGEPCVIQPSSPQAAAELARREEFLTRSYGASNVINQTPAAIFGNQDGRFSYDLGNSSITNQNNLVLSANRLQGGHEFIARHNGGVSNSFYKNHHPDFNHNGYYTQNFGRGNGAAGGTYYQQKHQYGKKQGYIKASHESKWPRDPTLKIRPDPTIADAPLVFDDIASKPIFEDDRLFQHQHGERIRVKLPVMPNRFDVFAKPFKPSKVKGNAKHLLYLQSDNYKKRMGFFNAPPLHASATSTGTTEVDLLGPLDPADEIRAKRAIIIEGFKNAVHRKAKGKSSQSSESSDADSPVTPIASLYHVNGLDEFFEAPAPPIDTNPAREVELFDPEFTPTTIGEVVAENKGNTESLIEPQTQIVGVDDAPLIFFD